MARSVGGTIGNFRGRLGKVTARVVNGETILSARSASFKESKNPKHIEVKEKFAVTSKFTKGVLELPALFQIWKLNKTLKLSEFNMVFQNNYAFSSPNTPTMQNIITPYGFVSPFTSAAINEGKLTVALSALNSIITVKNSEVNVSINAVICNYDPLKDSEPYFKITSVSKEVLDFNFSEPYNLEMKFNVESAATVKKYSKKIIYLAAATKSAYNEIVRYSQSFSLPSN
jgi:hypothetical protein